MAKQRKRAEDRKAEIVATAVRLAGEVGPDRVTTQALATAVGISQPAIFRHFPTKPDIWRAVGEVIARRMQMQEMAPENGGDPRAALEGLVKRHLGQIMQNPAIPAILFSRELHAENDGLRAHFARVMANRRAGFAALIAQAQARGQIPAGIGPEDLAALVLAAIQGLAMRWSLEARAFDLQAEGSRLIAALLGNAARRGADPGRG